MADDTPEPQPCEPRPPEPAPRPRGGRPPIPDEVWDRVRADYLDGLSAEVCARRHGVGVSSIRRRAAADGWRRTDQPWAPQGLALDPDDEGAFLESMIKGDFGKVRRVDLVVIADRRLMRAVVRGHAQEAARWRRLREELRFDLRNYMVAQGDDEDVEAEADVEAETDPET